MNYPDKKLFSTQGCAFRINNQELTSYPITLIVQDQEYAAWAAAGEKIFMNQYPYAYMGITPWLDDHVNDSALPVTHPLYLQSLELLLGQGEFVSVVYALSEKTLKQPGMKSICKKIKCHCKKAQHMLLRIMESDKSDYKEQFAMETGVELITYSSKQEAKNLFERLKKDVSCVNRPVYFDRLNREWAEWTNYSLTEPLTDMGNRILLVGDSISAGYGDMVQELLSRYHVDRLNTSEGTHHPNLYRMLQMMLEQYPYKVVHFNNGIHIHGISVEEYKKNLINIFQWIHLIAPETKIVFATTTPVGRKKNAQENNSFQSKSFQLGDRMPLDKNLKSESEYRYSLEDSELYMKLNKAATEVCNMFEVPVNDLFSLCISKNLPQADEVHFKEEGYQELAKAVAEVIENGIC